MTENAPLLGNDVEQGGLPPQGDPALNAALDAHLEEHYSNRAPWLRAAVLGANDGLVSVSSLMLGVGAASTDINTLILSGLSSWVAGAMSMAAGEYISVSSQRDAEQADIDKEIAAQKTPQTRALELEELVRIYMERGLDEPLARQVAVKLSEKDVIATHARDELGIDIEELANPWQAAFASLGAFTIGALIPLLAAAFIRDSWWRIFSVLVASTVGLICFGAVGAWLGGAKRVRASIRVLAGGWLAMGVTYAVGLLFGESAA